MAVQATILTVGRHLRMTVAMLNQSELRILSACHMQYHTQLIILAVAILRKLTLTSLFLVDQKIPLQILLAWVNSSNL